MSPRLREKLSSLLAVALSELDDASRDERIALEDLALAKASRKRLTEEVTELEAILEDSAND